MYYTPDCENARLSVEKLARLEPELVVTGHGRAMQGPEMRDGLHALSRGFDHIAVLSRGRYVNEPARADLKGVTSISAKNE